MTSNLPIDVFDYDVHEYKFYLSRDSQIKNDINVLISKSVSASIVYRIAIIGSYLHVVYRYEHPPTRSTFIYKFESASLRSEVDVSNDIDVMDLAFETAKKTMLIVERL